MNGILTLTFQCDFVAWSLLFSDSAIPRKKLKTKKELDLIRRASGPLSGVTSSSSSSSDEEEEISHQQQEETGNKRKFSVASSSGEEAGSKKHKSSSEMDEEQLASFYKVAVCREARVDMARLPRLMRSQLSEYDKVNNAYPVLYPNVSF
jgi:hypothetical protein